MEQKNCYQYNRKPINNHQALLLPGIVHTSLAQDPQRDAHASQEFVPELQIAGVPQIHPDHQSCVKVIPGRRHKWRHNVVQQESNSLTSALVCQHPPLQHQTASLCSLMAA